MINKLISFFSETAVRKTRDEESRRLTELIDDARRLMHAVDRGFNEVTDSDLTEYFIYEKRAAELRFKYLLKLYQSAAEADKIPAAETHGLEM